MTSLVLAVVGALAIGPVAHAEGPAAVGPGTTTGAAARPQPPRTTRSSPSSSSTSASASLAQIVALSQADDRSPAGDRGPADDRSADDAVAGRSPTSSATMPSSIPTRDGPASGSALATAAPSATPVGAIALLGALAAAAGGLWWRRRQTTNAPGNLLVIKEAVAIGPRRSLLVVDVAGRRVLLSSSEAGLGLLLDCGPTPVSGLNTDPERFFNDALASAMKSDAPTSLSLVSGPGSQSTLPQQVSSSSSSGPLLSQAAFRGDVEATEIVRRLQGGRNL